MRQATLGLTAVPSLPKCLAVATGFFFSLALAADGAVWGWGAQSSGAFGTTADSAEVRVSGNDQIHWVLPAPLSLGLAARWRASPAGVATTASAC